MSSFRPINMYVLIKPDPVPGKVGLIFIPDPTEHHKDKGYRFGEVIAAGPGMPLRKGGRWPMPVSTGEKVIYNPWGAREVKIDGVEHHILSDDSVLAVIE